MIDELTRLVRRQAVTGILVDSNLLLLLVVGRLDQWRIKQFERTRDFLIEDLRLLEFIVRQFTKILSTRHVLTEVSNLATRFKPLLSFRHAFQQTIEVIEERNCAAMEITRNKYFRKLGLTDAGILSLSDRRFLF